MLTPELKSKVDKLWDAFWSGGVANPTNVIEQITYLLFIKRLERAPDHQRAEGPRHRADR